MLDLDTLVAERARAIRDARAYIEYIDEHIHRIRRSALADAIEAAWGTDDAR